MKLKEPIQTLYDKGKAAMSDTLLISAAFQVPEQTAREILKLANFNLGDLAKVSTTELMKIRNISHSKAAAIVSTFEIGRRRWIAQPQTAYKINSSADAYNYFRPLLLDEVVEYFYILLLNRNNRVICHKMISQGGTSSTVADQKIIFKYALENLASGIILVHNHPSGALRPSQQDINLTKRLVNSGSTLEIPVLDHIIFTETAYFSFADEGMI